MIFNYLIPQHALSRFAGWMTRIKIKWFKNLQINWFVKRYAVDMKESILPTADDYPDFNTFFTRELRPGIRQICAEGIASPADGQVSQIGRVTSGQLIQAKGATFSLLELLGGQDDFSEEFAEANYATIYLSPRDYHRVHMPLTGTLLSMIAVPGYLFSVNEKAANTVPNLFARNERVIAVFETERGLMAVIMVGAMLVSSIKTVWAGAVTPPPSREVKRWNYEEQNYSLEKGEEMGLFQFGSTVIVLFADPKMVWHHHLQSGIAVQLGQSLSLTETHSVNHKTTIAG